jgi:hypothetical protein
MAPRLKPVLLGLSWYPTARLFRQSQPGQWADVARRVRGQLAT